MVFDEGTPGTSQKTWPRGPKCGHLGDQFLASSNVFEESVSPRGCCGTNSLHGSGSESAGKKFQFLIPHFESFEKSSPENCAMRAEPGPRSQM